MDIEVAFPGGRRVDARVGEFVVRTDQSVAHGGEGSAPEPFDLFLASLAACAGLYVAAFCRTRNLPVDDIRLVQHTENDATGKLVRVTIELHLPATFPAEWRDGITRAAASCKIKKTLAAPPRIDIVTTVAAAAA